MTFKVTLQVESHVTELDASSIFCSQCERCRSRRISRKWNSNHHQLSYSPCHCLRHSNFDTYLRRRLSRSRIWSFVKFQLEFNLKDLIFDRDSTYTSIGVVDGVTVNATNGQFCGVVTNLSPGVYSYFPIYRLADYQDQKKTILDSTTQAISYLLVIQLEFNLKINIIRVLYFWWLLFFPPLDLLFRSTTESFQCGEN